MRTVASVARVLSSAVEQFPSVHCTIRFEKPMSLPPMVTVTMVVAVVTDWIWVAIRSVVAAPVQATNVSEVFGRCCATSDGYA